LFIDIETCRFIAPEDPVGPPPGQQVGHVAVVAGAVALGRGGVVAARSGQDQPDHVVGAHGLVGVTRLGRDDVVGRRGDLGVVADDVGIEAQAAEGGGGYHGGAGPEFSVMAVFVASGAGRSPAGLLPARPSGGRPSTSTPTSCSSGAASCWPRATPTRR